MKSFEIFESAIKLKEDAMLKACLKLCEGAIRALEADDGENDFGIEWEPQPQAAGQGGITKDTGVAMKARRDREAAAENEKFKQLYDKLAQQFKVRKATDPAGAKKLLDQMKKLQALAKQKRGLKLGNTDTMI